jgi:hypothetical protein
VTASIAATDREKSSRSIGRLNSAPISCPSWSVAKKFVTRDRQLYASRAETGPFS